MSLSHWDHYGSMETICSSASTDVTLGDMGSGLRPGRAFLPWQMSYSLGVREPVSHLPPGDPSTSHSVFAPYVQAPHLIYPYEAQNDPHGEVGEDRAVAMAANYARSYLYQNSASTVDASLGPHTSGVFTPSEETLRFSHTRNLDAWSHAAQYFEDFYARKKWSKNKGKVWSTQC
ncbi:hypothetical protein AAHC03_013776 [Spirometra sp. Aus1]